MSKFLRVRHRKFPPIFLPFCCVVVGLKTFKMPISNVIRFVQYHIDLYCIRKAIFLSKVDRSIEITLLL